VPYSIENPQAGLVVVKLMGELSIAEIQSLNETVVAKYASEKLCIIYEVSELQRFPTSIPSLKMASAPIASNKNVKMQIVTGVKSPVFNFLFEVIGQLFKQSLRKTNTLEEALNVVDELKTKA
jgi:hypothetical protein